MPKQGILMVASQGPQNFINSLTFKESSRLNLEELSWRKQRDVVEMTLEWEPGVACGSGNNKDWPAFLAHLLRAWYCVQCGAHTSTGVLKCGRYFTGGTHFIEVKFT